MKLMRNIFVEWGRGFALICGLLLLAGCASTDTPPTTAGPKTTPPIDFSSDEIRVGEALQIEFYDIPTELKIDQIVQEDGSITLPFDKKVVAAKKKVAELQNEIRAIYVPRLFNRMTVNIRRGDRFVFVGGEVKNPGRQPYVGELTTLKAIQGAGDFTIYADKRKIQIYRTNGKTDHVDYYKARKDPKLDLPIYPGDRIDVHLSWK